MSAVSNPRITHSAHPPTTLLPSVRSALNEALLRNAAIPPLHAALLHECQASGYLERVRTRARDLLRNGDCGSYGELMAVVMAEVRAGLAEAAAAAAAAAAAGTTAATTTTATATVNGKNDRAKAKDVVAINGDGVAGGESLRVPKSVLDEGARLIRGAIEDVVDVEDGEGRGG